MSCDGCYKLNLGCGVNPRDGGFVNHDITAHHDYVDIVHDLNEIPWPWEDNQWDLIKAFSVFEHLENDLITTLDECWRILKPSGILNIKYPLYKNPRIGDDPTHRWTTWTMHTLDFVDPDTEYGKKCYYYTNRHWKIRTKKEHKERNCLAILIPIK